MADGGEKLSAAANVILIVSNVTDTDALPDSFRQYVVANMMVAQDKKAYLTTTGYNRNELFFAEDRPGA